MTTSRREIELESSELSRALRKINSLLSDYLAELYRYNSSIRNSPYYLKPVHVVYRVNSSGERVMYVYYGRYWYKLLRRGGLKWIYVGRDLPDRSLPEPPANPLEGLRIRVSESGVRISSASEEVLRLVERALSEL